ncbi:MAG: metallophosphoesterase [Prolixibacteraceae bacterium]|nr:metallophosphoesterase [Prolixibacteraceae bacterium]
MYDIIGDVHGHAQPLKKMLINLGYQKTEQGFYNPDRKAIFVGDFVNRGPNIRKTIRIIRNMVENGNAFAVLGNHELNFLISGFRGRAGEVIVKPPVKNSIAGLKTLREFSEYEDEWISHLNWLRTLPFFLELDGIRVIHACWADSAVEYLRENIAGEKIKKRILKYIYKNPDSEMARNIGLVTKGPHFKMPGDLKIINNKGVSPRSFRIRWWEDPIGKTFEAISFESKFKLPEYTVPNEIMPQFYPYEKINPILFFGHYCRFRGPHIISSNLCCVDSCVAGSKSLTAYHWDGEAELKESNIVKV